MLRIIVIITYYGTRTGLLINFERVKDHESSVNNILKLDTNIKFRCFLLFFFVKNEHIVHFVICKGL